MSDYVYGYWYADLERDDPPSTEPPRFNPRPDQRVFVPSQSEDDSLWVFGPGTFNEQGDYYYQMTYVEPAGYTLEELIADGYHEVFDHWDPDLIMDNGL